MTGQDQFYRSGKRTWRKARARTTASARADAVTDALNALSTLLPIWRRGCRSGSACGRADLVVFERGAQL